MKLQRLPKESMVSTKLPGKNSERYLHYNTILPPQSERFRTRTT